jgi:hypothetical protein
MANRLQDYSLRAYSSVIQGPPRLFVSKMHPLVQQWGDGITGSSGACAPVVVHRTESLELKETNAQISARGADHLGTVVEDNLVLLLCEPGVRGQSREHNWPSLN